MDDDDDGGGAVVVGDELSLFKPLAADFASLTRLFKSDIIPDRDIAVFCWCSSIIDYLLFYCLLQLFNEDGWGY